MDVRHERRGLLVSRQDEPNGAVVKGIHQLEVLLARDAEGEPDALVLKAVDQQSGRFHAPPMSPRDLVHLRERKPKKWSPPWSPSRTSRETKQRPLDVSAATRSRQGLRYMIVKTSGYAVSMSKNRLQGRGGGLRPSTCRDEVSLCVRHYRGSRTFFGRTLDPQFSELAFALGLAEAATFLPAFVPISSSCRRAY